MHGSKAVFQGDRREIATVHRGDVDAAGLQQPVAEGQPLGAVVVAADEEGMELALCQAAEKVVKQRDSLGGGDAFVVHISGNQHGLRLLGIDNLQNLQQDVFLVFQHGDFVEPLAQVQVGQVDEFHRQSPLAFWKEWAISQDTKWNCLHCSP